MASRPLQNPDLLDPGGLRAAAPDERARRIERFICGQLDGLLHIPPALRIDTAKPLRTQGVGSILGLHLKKQLERTLHVDVGAATRLPDDSVTALAARLAARLGGDPVPAGPPAGRNPAHRSGGGAA